MVSNLSEAVWDLFFATVNSGKFNEATELIMPAALAGNARAKCTLAQFITQGLIPSSAVTTVELAIEWLTQLADAGDGYASLALAQAYILPASGKAEHERRTLAKQYLELAKSQGVSLTALFDENITIDQYLSEIIHHVR